MGQWVNFKSLRQSLNFGDVLESYGVKLKLKGDQHQGFCPLPGHDGKQRSPSFSANLTKGIFQCFGCGAKGNVIDFAVRMENLAPENQGDFRKAALLLQARFLGEPAAPDDETTASEEVIVEKEGAGDDRSHVVNAPLQFELKRLDLAHPYLASRGLAPETIAFFGLGYADRGLMKGRVAIPLHDTEGQLVGYAGRLVDDADVNEENPKYKLPGMRERDGTVYEFSKSRFLFNGYRLDASLEDLIVVEGFFGAFWLHQNGHKDVVALMGSSCSAEQGLAIIDLVEPDGRVWVMPDGDAAGDACAASVFARVGPERFIKWVKLPKGTQPDGLPADELAEALSLPV